MGPIIMVDFLYAIVSSSLLAGLTQLLNETGLICNKFYFEERYQPFLPENLKISKLLVSRFSIIKKIPSTSHQKSSTFKQGTLYFPIFDQEKRGISNSFSNIYFFP